MTLITRETRKEPMWVRSTLMPDFAQGDLCIGFFKEMFAAQRLPPFPEAARVLEVGCAEVDWLTPMKALRPDLHLTGLDQRKHPERPGADVLVQGNLMNASQFLDASFDAIVAISVIEHVGIGRYADPIDADGDTKAMASLKRWLKPEGFLYMDVPFRPSGPSTPFRQYNRDDLLRRVVTGWTIEDEQVFDADHPDAPYIALVLRPA